MYQRIIVPLDGSALAELALPDAEHLARLIDIPIHVVRVVDLTGRPSYGQVEMSSDSVTSEQMASAESDAAVVYLQAVTQRLADAGIETVPEVRRGQPSRALIDVTRPGDLIVMASHGRSGMIRWFLGSVAEEVVRHAAVPVLLLRASKPEMSQNEPTPALATRS